MQYFYLRILLFLLAASAEKSLAQQLIFKSYAINEGLVHNAVRGISQDSKGFLWIATWEGLSKYDGHRFTNFSATNGLSNDFINDVVETKEGIIYITCNDGSLYSITNNAPPKKIPTIGVVINRLIAVAPGKYLALTDLNGIYEFKDEKLYKQSQYGASHNYFDVEAFNDSLLIVLSDYSVQLLNLRYQLFSQHRASVPIYSEGNLLKDSKNRIWLSTRNGLKLVSPHQEKGKSMQFLELPFPFSHPLLQNQWITAMMEDAEGNFWFGTPQGIVKIGANNLVQLISEKNGLPVNNVTCIYQDREKNIWIGSSRGIARLATTTGIRIFTMQDGLNTNNIIQVLPLANGDVLAGSDAGMFLYQKSISQFQQVTENRYAVNQKEGAVSLQSSVFSNWCISFQQKPFHFSFFSATPIGGYYVFRDSAGNYFTHTHSGVIMSADLKAWQKALFPFDTRVVMLDTKGALWAGTRDSGLFRIRYHYKNGVAEITDKKHFLTGISIRSLYEDSKGNIWAGSRYQGVFCINKNDESIKQFNQKDGLTSNRITSIAEDKAGAIWLSFYSGLDKLVRTNNSFRVFNFSRIHNFFTIIQGMAIDDEHSLWLATTQGLVNIIDGKAEKTKPLKTIITLANLGDSIYHYSPSVKPELSYRQNNVHFEYAAPGFINEKQIFYSYRLLGSEKEEWSRPFNEYGVSFASLRHGNYRFEVRTLGANNQWGGAAGFTFNISPPFWMAWWFIGAIVMLIATTGFFVFRKRIKNIRRRAELKHKLANAEMMALRSQMNPHFIFNCLSAIDNLIQTAQTDRATTYLARFAKLMRSILESSKNNLVPFNKDFETLSLFLQLEKFRCNDKFTYELTADEELLHGDYKVPPLIVQPFVENAIHHGLLNKQKGEKKLLVNASLQQNKIHYTITDNGVGRARANEIKVLNKPEHLSYGIQITADRVHLHNQNARLNGFVGRGRTNDIQITDLMENGEPGGTRVEVQLKTEQ